AHLAEGGTEIVVGLEVFVFSTHFAELGTKFVKDFLEGTVFSRSSALFLRLRRGSWRRSLRVGMHERVEAEVVDLLRQVRKKLVGSKPGSRRGGGIFCGGRRFRLGLGNHNWSCGRLLVVSGDQRLRLEDQLVVLIQFKFGFGGGRGVLAESGVFRDWRGAGFFER